VSGEEGSSPLTSVFGVGVFLGFLLLAVQVLLHLYGTSTVSAAAFDGARLMAAEDGVSCGAASDHVRGLLGDYGARVAISCPSTGDVAAVQVAGPSPAPMVDGFLGGFDLGDIERTARVRVEDFRPEAAGG
jgi:hypothetical protein